MSAAPVELVTPETVIVYEVLAARGVDGVKNATSVPELYDTAPATGLGLVS